MLLLISELMGYRLAMEVEAVDVVGEKQKEVDHVIFEEVGKKNLLAQSKQTVLKIKSSLFRKALVRINELLPLLFRKVSIVTRNRQIMAPKYL